MRAVFGADPITSGRVISSAKRPRSNRRRWRSEPESAAAGGSETARPRAHVVRASQHEHGEPGRLTSNLLLRKDDERKQANGFVDKLRIVTPSVNQQVQYLSGGNQQKVVLAKWLASQSRVLIFDKPTRGIDVGAKVEVYNLMNSLVENGVAVIMVSSEMPELLGMSDRILVMHEGRIAAELSRQEATQEKVLAAAMGADKDE